MRIARLLVSAAVVVSSLTLVPADAQAPSTQPAPVVVAIVGEFGANVLHEQFQLPAASILPGPAGAPRTATVPLPGPGVFDARLLAAAKGTLGHLPAHQLLRVAGTNVLITNVDAAPYDLLADREHGTGVLGSAAARDTGSAPKALYVLVMGDTGRAWEWVARQPWIDLVSTSHFEAGGGEQLSDTLCRHGREVRAVVRAAKPILSAGGNDTQIEHLSVPTGLPEVIRVGGVDAAGAADPMATKPYEVGDIFAPTQLPSPNDDHAVGGSWGTSFAAPRAAGRAAELIAVARSVVGDRGSGVRGGRLAVGPRHPTRGSLADGGLTAAELRRLLQDTATPTLPSPETRYAYEGFGALGSAQMRLAGKVLAGTATAPDRAPERRLLTVHQAAAAAAFNEARCGS